MADQLRLPGRLPCSTQLPRSEPAEYYTQRVQLYELYHHVNHALMFGGSYRSGAIRIMKGLIAWADSELPKTKRKSEL